MIRHLVPEAAIFEQDIFREPAYYHSGQYQHADDDDGYDDDHDESGEEGKQGADTASDSTSVASPAARIYSSSCIETTAITLLNSIEDNTSTQNCKVLLSGYGFGGFVVKQVHKGTF